MNEMDLYSLTLIFLFLKKKDPGSDKKVELRRREGLPTNLFFLGVDTDRKSDRYNARSSVSSQPTAGQKTFAMQRVKKRNWLRRLTIRSHRRGMYTMTMCGASNYLCLAVAATSHSG